jgi:hypothetical protein
MAKRRRRSTVDEVGRGSLIHCFKAHEGVVLK